MGSSGQSTQHMNLNQWQLTDSPGMNDFNTDNQKIENAVMSHSHKGNGDGVKIAYADILNTPASLPANGGNATTVGGFAPSPSQPVGLNTPYIPVVQGGGAGVMEIGQYIDFHIAGNNKDFDARLSARPDGTVDGTIQQAVKLQTARTINGTAFDGTGNITLTDRNNQANDITVAKELRWRNYGNNHTIVDNSAGTYPGGNGNAQVQWTPTYPILVGYNGTNTYGVKVDTARYADIANTATSAGHAQLATSGGALGYYVMRNIMIPAGPNTQPVGGSSGDIWLEWTV